MYMEIKMRSHSDVPEPEIENRQMRAIMRRAAKGSIDALAALQELVTLREAKDRSTEQAQAALDYARKVVVDNIGSMKIDDGRIRDLADRALRHDLDAMYTLKVAAADEAFAARAEATEVLWLVEAKWDANEWPTS